jgi:hypothetical protein
MVLNSDAGIGGFNDSNRFIIDYKPEIILNGNWEVALTEFMLEYTSVQDTKIEYIDFEKVIEKHVLSISGGKFTNEEMDKKVYKGKPDITLTDDKRLSIFCKVIPFAIRFESAVDAKSFGFKTEYISTSQEHTIVGDPLNMKQHLEVNVKIENRTLNEKHQYITMKENLLFKSNKELITYFLKTCQNVFETFQIDNKGLITIKLKDNINHVSFDMRLATNLGFSKNRTLYHTIYNKATEKPMLTNTAYRIIVQSNITQPIYMDNKLMPIIGVLWIQNSENLGDVFFENVVSPMYLPVTVFSINNIEIIIKNVQNQVIAFPLNTKTSLRLHFRKYE